MKEKNLFMIFCGFFILSCVIILLICDLTKTKSALYIREITSAAQISEPASDTLSSASLNTGGENITESTAPQKININTATAEELTALPGIGEKTAEKIVKYRTENGSFYSIEEIMEVKGIGEAKFDAIRDMIIV